ncbi:MAG: PPOX class F420-dependent oxidoreductase [Actinomycetota bacterium]
MAGLTEDDVALLRARNHVHFVTLHPDGSPHVTPMWVDADEAGHVLVNTSVGRVKDRNVRRDPRVALSVMDANDPYRWVSVTGEVVEMIEGPAADAHIDALCHRYHDEPWEPVPGQRRVIYRVRPDRVARGLG